MNANRIALLLAAGVLAAWLLAERRAPQEAPVASTPAAATASDDLAADRATREVTGQGIVLRVLRDDTNGERHQRILLRLASGDTLLVAHNLDLAPRVEPLQPGDTLAFHGEYVWNEKGGVVHWTHHDPAGQHAAGWLRHDGRTFQ